MTPTLRKRYPFPFIKRTSRTRHPQMPAAKAAFLDIVATCSYIGSPMKAVGIRELKNRLSEYIRLVKGGEDILVADRGEVVAELRPPGQSPLFSQYPGLSDLVRQGKVRLGAPNDPALYPRLKKLLDHEEVVRLLDEERGEH